MENGNDYKVAAPVPQVVSLLEWIVMPPGTWEASNNLLNTCFSTPVSKDQAIFFYLTSLLFYLEAILILQSSVII